MTTEAQGATAETPNTPPPPSTHATIENKSGSVTLADFFDPKHPLGGDGNGVQEKTQETKEVKPAKEAKAEPKAAEPVSSDGSKGAEEEEGDAEDEDDEESSEGTAKAESEDSPAPPIKQYKFKAGDKEIELPEDAEILVPVDGKDHKVTLKDLRANWSGQHFVKQKLTEVDKQRRAVEAEKQTIAQEKTKFQNDIAVVDKGIKKVVDLVKTKNIYGAVEVLAKMAKRDRTEVLKDIVTQAEAIAKETSTLTPEQKEMLFRQKATEYKAAELEEEKKALLEKHSDTELRAYTLQLQAQNKVTNEELAHGWDVIQRAGVDPKWTATDIADKVVGYIKAERHIKHVMNAASKVSPTLVQGEEGKKFMQELLPLVDESFTEQDIIDIVKGVYTPPQKSVQVAPPEESTKDAKEETATPKQEASSKAKPSRGPSKQEKPKTEDEKKVYLSMSDILADYR